MIDVPYAQMMGACSKKTLNNEIVFFLPFSEKNIGNTALPALHGGLLGGFMEYSAQAYLIETNELKNSPKIINFSIDYLRSGRAEETFARCSITKQGRRVVHVSITAWQKEESKPIAVARAHFLIHPSLS